MARSKRCQASGANSNSLALPEGFVMVDLPAMAEHERQIYTALGYLAIEWNLTEERMRSLLSHFMHPQTDHPSVGEPRRRGHLATTIVTIEMGTVGITQALNAIAQSLPSNEQDAIEWTAECFDRLRGYRNFYIHGITAAAPSSDLGPIGIVIMTSAKGEFAQDKDFIRIEQIADVVSRAIALRTYIGAVLNYLCWTPDSYLPVRPRLPVAPPMPERLKKNREYLLRP
jgi:hypothetical protein